MTLPLTVTAVRSLCEAAGKDYAVVIAVQGGQTQFVTWGREANHKVQASDLAEYLGDHLCGPDAPTVVTESFHRKEEAARNKARVEELEGKLAATVAACKGLLRKWPGLALDAADALAPAMRAASDAVALAEGKP